ncbi:MAG: hypothetical protein ACXWYS_08610, partial [Gaiellaceae bacterium]
MVAQPPGKAEAAPPTRAVALRLVRDLTAPGGLPEYNAVDPDSRESLEDPPNPALAWERLAPQPEIVQFFSGLYGPYPFE